MKNPLEEVYKSSMKFLTPLDLETTYKSVVHEAMRLLQADEGTILLFDSGELRRVYATKEELFLIRPRKRGLSYRVYKTKKPLVLSNHELYKLHSEMEEMKIKHDMIFPLIYEDNSYGVISIMSTKKKFGRKDMDILNLFMPLASMAIRKAQLYHDLSNALKTRNLFISMASHELKTPVTAVYTFMQIIKRRIKKGEEFEEKWIDNLMYEMVRLNKLIDELLQINQIKTGELKYEWEELNLVEVIERSLESFNATHKNANVVFNNKLKADKIEIIGDFNKLIQVIINLLDNSAKHSDPNDKIELLLKRTRRWVVLEVIDEGEGIRKDDIDKIFNDFYKGKGHTKAGMGLGLFLIKQIVDKHRGRIEIKSELRRGTNVKVYLPEPR